MSAEAFDAVVVGAGPAGLNAALVLARARRRVLVIDAGEPRNAASHAMHGFLSRDGLDPAELRNIGRLQLEAYPGARLIRATAEEAGPVGGGFEVRSSEGGSVVARKLLLAVGVQDEVPAIGGFAELYGHSAFHCPYCDGWEVRDRSVAVLSEDPAGVRLALLLLAWSRDVVFCTNGRGELGPAEMAQLASQGIAVEGRSLARLEGTGGRLDRLVFKDGTSLARDVLFFHGPVRLSSRLPERLGCELTSAGRIQIDEAGRTSVPGLYAAGDGARRPGQHPVTQVILAAASGAMAGIALHQELMHEDVGLTPALPALSQSRANR